MKRDALISRGQVGLNIYLPEELRAHLGDRRLSVEIADLREGTRCLRLFASENGRNRVAVHISPTHPIRIAIANANLPRDIRNLGPFGTTNVVWSVGKQPGEVYFTLPPASALPAPRIVHRSALRKKPAPAPALAVAAATYRSRLAAWLAEGRALLAELPDSHTLTATAEPGGASVELGRSSVLRVQIVEDL